MSSVSVGSVFTDLFNGLLAIIDQIALAVQSNAGIIATIGDNRRSCWRHIPLRQEANQLVQGLYGVIA